MVQPPALQGLGPELNAAAGAVTEEPQAFVSPALLAPPHLTVSVWPLSDITTAPLRASTMFAEPCARCCGIGGQGEGRRAAQAATAAAPQQAAPASRTARRLHSPITSATHLRGARGHKGTAAAHAQRVD